MWQSLFTIYTISAFVVTGVVFALFFYFLVRYKEKPDTPEPEDAPRVAIMPDRGSPMAAFVLAIILAVLFLGLTIGTFTRLDFIEELPESSEAFSIQVVGFQWGWRFIYANGKILTGELRVPVETPIILEITSQDVFHTFAIPEFKIKKDAIPGRINIIWFEANFASEFAIRCYELCGTGHAEMLATLLVMETDQFNVWYQGGN
ncbi:MAG: cytochrome c oxidase subunit II [Candidatus Geothermarchaeales archaeon]